MNRESVRDHRCGRRAGQLPLWQALRCWRRPAAAPCASAGTGTGQASAQRIQVLTSALMLMQQNYGKLRQDLVP